MFLQWFVRGMRGLGPDEVRYILDTGMQCQALRNDPGRPQWELEGELTDENLDRHRHDHDRYGNDSPYVSTTAGTYREGGRFRRHNESLFAFDTALSFAVITSRSNGWIFYGYHFLLGRPAGRHAEFAEEVRDLHQHPVWSRYRGEGEIAAAIRIPPRRLQRAEFYSFANVDEAIRQKAPIEPDDVVPNPGFVEPRELLAPRGVV